MNKFLIVLSICSFFISCHRKAISPDHKKKNHSTSVNNNIPELPIFLNKMTSSDTNFSKIPVLLKFEKTACFGFCPVYEFSLYSNGIACYNGKHFVKKEGKTYGLFKEKLWKEIKSKAENIQFISFSNNYPIESQNEIPDLAKTIISLNFYGQIKTITDSHSAPKELKGLEDFIENAINLFLDEHLE